MGLQKLGKGDWRGISRTFITSRTPTQVASHAQKHFIRQINSSKRRRRSSLFDIVADSDQLPVAEKPRLVSSASAPSLAIETDSSPLPPSRLDLDPESELTETSSKELFVAEAPSVAHPSVPVMLPAFFTPYGPVPLPFWSPPLYVVAPEKDSEHHQVWKPTAMLPKDPINVEELVGMSKLSLGDTSARHTPETLDLAGKLIGSSDRQSAFHANPSVAGHSEGIIEAL